MKKYRFSSITAGLLAIGITTGTLGIAPANANVVESCYEQYCTVWFSHSGQIQTWHPPINARNMTFQVSGGQGGKSGGQGGRVTGTLSQIPDTLYIAVAGAGITGNSAAGGFNGGGQAGSGSNNEGSGGGSSDIRLGTNVESRIVVAGGGGGRGAGITPTPSPGGGLIAANGKDGQGQGGGGGTQTAGGAGGLANGTGTSGSDGSLLVGGRGGTSSLYGGGGGGGGYYGGGGGGSDSDSSGNDAGAGGGGSSYADPLYTSNVSHSQGVKSGHGLVMFEYQLVPLFESITSQTQLSNKAALDFQIELSGPFANFSASHIQLIGDPGTCQPGTLTGIGTSFTYTAVDCVEGQVGISIPENSISVQGYSGPEVTQTSDLVTIDRTAPEVSEITKEESELTIPISESVLQPGDENYRFTSSKNSCQVESLVATSDQTWLATLDSCDSASYSFKILANSISDFAGNTGPIEDVTFTVSLPAVEEVAAPAPGTSSTSSAAPSGPSSQSSSISAPQAGVSPDLASPSSTGEDSEVILAPRPRRQAAQSVIRASTSSDAVNSGLGWMVGLAIAGVLLLVAGLSLRRKGVSDLLAS